jgi:pyruvate dehydrogenase E2 component (dihydrolipoamide acetyltransferase)
MARNMADAWATVPHVTIFDEIDGRPLLAAQRTLRGDGRLPLTTFFVRACVLALAEVPILHASLDLERGEVVEHARAHVGVAVAGDDGLVVPVVHDAGSLSLRELADTIDGLVTATRRGDVRPEQLQGATFTVSNFGTHGGRFGTPIIRPPQVAILGVGAIRVRPVVADGAVVAAPTVPLSLSIDHRLIDGEDATRFLDTVATLLAEPVRLVAAPA